MLSNIFRNLLVTIPLLTKWTTKGAYSSLFFAIVSLYILLFIKIRCNSERDRWDGKFQHSRYAQNCDILGANKTQGSSEVPSSGRTRAISRSAPQIYNVERRDPRSAIPAQTRRRWFRLESVLHQSAALGGFSSWKSKTELARSHDSKSIMVLIYICFQCTFLNNYNFKFFSFSREHSLIFLWI